MNDIPVILYLGNNSYRASQFSIRLDGPLDVNTIFRDIEENPPLRALFLHEYIHFLQDVTTRYGLMKAANLYAYTSQIAHCVRADGRSTFAIPQTLSGGNNVDNVILTNFKTWRYSLGNSFEVRSKYEEKDLSVSNVRCNIKKVCGADVEQIELTIKEKGGNYLGKIDFGGEIMSESMAFIAEQLYSEKNGVPQYGVKAYPYRITELLVEHVYPELLERRDLIYLCIDACLYVAFTPGVAFYLLLVHLKECEFHDGWNLNLVSDFLGKRYAKNIPFALCVTETIRLVRQNFQIKELDSTVKWLEKIYERAKLLRQFPMFMKCFIGEGKQDKAFSRIVTDLMGIPPLHNDIDEAAMKMPINMLTHLDAYNVHPEYFHAISCVLSLFNGKTQCGLRNFCKASRSLNPNIEVNDTCNRPWEKLDEVLQGKKELCPFAFLWKHWGLSGKTPIF